MSWSGFKRNAQRAKTQFTTNTENLERRKDVEPEASSLSASEFPPVVHGEQLFRLPYRTYIVSSNYEAVYSDEISLQKG